MNHGSFNRALIAQEALKAPIPVKEGRGNYFLPSNEFAVSFTPIRAGIFNIYLFGVIEDANQFISAIEVLQAAGENDVVLIHLSTDGGSLDATDTFITAMQECEARVIVKASGGVHSAGTVILLNADEFVLSENFNALIHNGSTWSGGKFSDWKSQTKHTERYMEKVMRTTYENFLTDKEIDELLDGKDLWLDADAFMERMQRRNDIRATKAENARDEVLNSLIAQHQEQALLDVPKVKPKRKKKEEVAEVE